MAVTIGTIGTIITVAAAGVRIAGPLFRAATTAAQRLEANSRAAPKKNVDHIYNPGSPVVPQSSNNQGLFNAINHHKATLGAAQTPFQAHVDPVTFVKK